jgi:hypothetical protein
MLNHKTYNQAFIANPGQLPASKYGITIVKPDPTLGKVQWRCIGVHHLTGQENAGNHHVYLDVLDEKGNRINGARLMVVNNGKVPYQVTIDKPADEAGANLPMYWNDILAIYIAGDHPGDKVVGFHTRHEDEEQGTTRGHHSFYVVWQRQVVTETEPEPEPEEPEQPEEPTPDPVDWRAKLGIGQLWLVGQHLRLRSTPESELIARMAELLDGAE